MKHAESPANIALVEEKTFCWAANLWVFWFDWIQTVHQTLKAGIKLMRELQSDGLTIPIILTALLVCMLQTIVYFAFWMSGVATTVERQLRSSDMFQENKLNITN